MRRPRSLPVTSATNLRDEQHANLMHYLATYPVLQQLYVAKQRLVRLMLLKTLTAKRARKKLPQLLELMDQLRDSPLRALAKTLTSWLEPIVAMWRFRRGCTGVRRANLPSVRDTPL